MTINLHDLQDIEYKELSDLELDLITGGKLFGCLTGGFVGAISGGVILGPPLAYVGCKVGSAVENKIDYS